MRRTYDRRSVLKLACAGTASAALVLTAPGIVNGAPLRRRSSAAERARGWDYTEVIHADGSATYYFKDPELAAMMRRYLLLPLPVLDWFARTYMDWIMSACREGQLDDAALTALRASPRWDEMQDKWTHWTALYPEEVTAFRAGRAA